MRGLKGERKSFFFAINSEWFQLFENFQMILWSTFNSPKKNVFWQFSWKCIVTSSKRNKANILMFWNIVLCLKPNYDALWRPKNALTRKLSRDSICRKLNSDLKLIKKISNTTHLACSIAVCSIFSPLMWTAYLSGVRTFDSSFGK